MDKESNERMAPALHTTGSESTDSGIINYSSCSPPPEHVEDNMFKELNGVFSSCDEKDVQNIVKLYPYISNYKKDSPNTLSYGNCGDNGGMGIHKQDLSSVLEKTKSTRNQMFKSSGDADGISKVVSLKETNVTQCNVTTALNISISVSTTLDGFTSSTLTSTANKVSYSNSTANKKFENPDEERSCFVTNNSPGCITTSSTDLITNSCTTINRTPPLVVNVDKHDSVNPQIIHTTSITTSPMNVTHSSEFEQDTSTCSQFQVSSTSHWHKSKDIKTLKGGSTFEDDNSNLNSEKNIRKFLNQTLKSEKVFSNSGDSSSHLKTETLSSCSNNFSFESEDKHDPYLNNNTNGAGLSTTVEIDPPSSSKPYSSGFIDKAIFSYKDNDACCSNNFGFTSNGVYTLSKGDSINTSTSTQNVFAKVTKAPSVSLSSVTQTTPVYNTKRSIPTYRFDQPLPMAMSVASKSEVKSTVSSQIVPCLKDLTQDFVSTSMLQQLPTNVTNTLQDLAASLTFKHVSESLEQSEAANLRCIQTKLLQSGSDNDRSSEIQSPDLNYITRRLEAQHSEVVKSNAALQTKVSCLQLRLNRLRATAITRHARRHLPRRKSSKSSFSDTKVDGLINSSLPKQLSQFSGENFSDKRNTSLSSFKSSNLGIFKKELLAARERIDPDLTDSSSDDEIDPVVKKVDISERFHNSSHSTCPLQKTALWNWAHDRISIAHRWTWLNAHVTSIEFKIKQHEELMQQLRSAKGETVFEKPSIPSLSTLDIEQTEKSLANTRNSPSRNFATSPSPVLSDDVDRSVDRTFELNFSASDTFQPQSNSFSKENNTSFERCLALDDDGTTCARVRPLKKRLRHSKVVKLSDVYTLRGKKQLKAPTIRNDCEIMVADHFQHTPFNRSDGKSRDIEHSSMRSRAAMHDHSYHKILSTAEDIPISTRLNGALLTSNKQFAAKLRRYERRSDKRQKRKQKEAKQREERLMDKIKSRPRSATVVLERADKLIRSVSALQRNTSFEDRSSHIDFKKRRSTASLSEFKRSRVTSFDSDAESLYNRSESGTPVFDSSSSCSHNPQYQAFLKRKRANDHAYDINNIVIPHGLTSTRIEKLQYKEILTPGWRTTEKNSSQPENAEIDDDVEDVSNEVFKSRHDRHEILEKKKYMSYLEKNINKRTGARSMSRANLPLDDHPTFFSPTFRSSPTSALSPSDFAAPASPEPYSPSLMLRSRRSSSEQSLHNNISSQLAPDRFRGHEATSPDDAQPRHVQRENSNAELWEPRTFPLTDMVWDEMTKDPVVCIKKLPKELESSQVFQPITTQSDVGVSHVAAKQKTSSKSDFIAPKRSRSNSHVSRDEDRFSDDSISSSRSLHRVRSGASDSVSNTRASSPATSTLPSQRKRHKPSHKDDYFYYPNLELSSTSDSETDDTRTTTDAQLLKLSSQSEWVSRESTPRRNTSGDDETSPGQKPPLLLKVKKKFLL